MWKTMLEEGMDPAVDIDLGFGNRICVTVDGINIVEESDGIYGEIFSENGWFAKYSKDGEPFGKV